MKNAHTTIDLPSVLSDAELFAAFAGRPEALALLQQRPDLLAGLRAKPQHLGEVVELLTEQAARAAKMTTLQAEIAQCVRALLPTAFLDSLPATLHGFTQQEPGYWLEPEVQAVRPDSDKWICHGTLSDVNHWVANSMAPRFLNGVSFVMEEVLPGEELVPGSVYRLEFGVPLASGGGTLFRLIRVEQTKQGDILIVEHDADPCPAGHRDQWALRLGAPDWRLYRFLHYHSFTGLQLPTKAFPARPWAQILESDRQYQEKKAARKAKRQAALALRQQAITQPQELALAA
ncbi:hypothetical protein [Hymenobacter pini]|uniref:hypothetical protein n=1 Tax=Hymenobacter pini TaxID=2880879 RepID=UPI001CF40071|nr:hypothetical protein [Hymenobacter pini]MCA8830305.1 hypothetical protein [Hymenobacter pini]